MTVDKIIVDKMTIDKIILYKMTVDKMTKESNHTPFLFKTVA